MLLQATKYKKAFLSSLVAQKLNQKIVNVEFILILEHLFSIPLEIKPCGLGSRIRDIEAEWRLKAITDLISW